MTVYQRLVALLRAHYHELITDDELVQEISYLLLRHGARTIGLILQAALATYPSPN